MDMQHQPADNQPELEMLPEVQHLAEDQFDPFVWIYAIEGEHGVYKNWALCPDWVEPKLYERILYNNVHTNLIFKPFDEEMEAIIRAEDAQRRLERRDSMTWKLMEKCGGVVTVAVLTNSRRRLHLHLRRLHNDADDLARRFGIVPPQQ